MNFYPTSSLPTGRYPRLALGFHLFSYSMVAPSEDHSEGIPKSSESIISYILGIRDGLAKLQELVRENLENIQQCQKVWYDRHARDREL